MRKLLLIGPFDIVLGSLSVVVVVSGGLISELLLELDLSAKLLSCGLSPSVIVLEEHVVEMSVWLSHW